MFNTIPSLDNIHGCDCNNYPRATIAHEVFLYCIIKCTSNTISYLRVQRCSSTFRLTALNFINVPIRTLLGYYWILFSFYVVKSFVYIKYCSVQCWINVISAICVGNNTSALRGVFSFFRHESQPSPWCRKQTVSI